MKKTRPGKLLFMMLLSLALLLGGCGSVSRSLYYSGNDDPLGLRKIQGRIYEVNMPDFGQIQASNGQDSQNSTGAPEANDKAENTGDSTASAEESAEAPGGNEANSADGSEGADGSDAADGSDGSDAIETSESDGTEKSDEAEGSAEADDSKPSGP